MVEQSIKELLFDLTRARTPADVLKAWISNADHPLDLNLIIALNDYHRHAYPEGLNALLRAANYDFVAYFQSDNLFFLDNQLLRDMSINGTEDTIIELDYSIMFDTNYSSYISRFVKNQMNKSASILDHESIYHTIDILLKKDYQYDYLFYLIENYDTVVRTGNTGFTASLSSHVSLYENLVYLEMFKSINSHKYDEKNTIEFEISEFEAKQNVDDLITKLYKSEAAQDTMKVFLDFHKQITLLLIGMLRIQYESKRSPLKKITELFNYASETVGVYLEREMIVACKYLKQPADVPIFKVINKGGNQTKLLRKIQNIAWDFMVPRVMEFLISRNKRYFMPIFLSHDLNLRKLLNLFYIKGVLRDTSNTLIPFPEVTSLDFYKTQGIDLVNSPFFTNEGQRHRKRIADENIANQFEIINHELSKLIKVLSGN